MTTALIVTVMSIANKRLPSYYVPSHWPCHLLDDTRETNDRDDPLYIFTMSLLVNSDGNCLQVFLPQPPNFPNTTAVSSGRIIAGPCFFCLIGKTTPLPRFLYCCATTSWQEAIEMVVFKGRVMEFIYLYNMLLELLIGH